MKVAILFVSFSWLLFLIQPESLSLALLGPACFFLGSIASFVLLIRSGGVFAALAWFVLGSGIYFGLGVVVGGVAPDPRSVHYVSDVTLLTDLFRINVLNSSSVALILVVALPLAYRPRGAAMARVPEYVVSQREIDGVLVRLYPYVTLVAIAAVLLELASFPNASNLILRTLLSSAHFAVPLCVLSLGMLWSRLPSAWVSLGVLVFVSSTITSVLQMSKFAVMSDAVALVVGVWVHRRSRRSIVAGLLALGTIYVSVSPIVTEGRGQVGYDAEDNSPIDRVLIAIDVIAGNSKTNTAVVEGPSSTVAKPLLRFSVAEIQGYLIQEYEDGKPGKSLDDAWAAAIPRLLWPDKPNITRFGAELHGLYWAKADPTSALAPTYTGEAYWDYGPAGVVVVSILIGLELGWLTGRWHIAALGKDPAFFLIAFPTALWASFVESWIAATYVGGFLTLVGLWYIARVLVVKLLIGALHKNRLRLKTLAV
ncbi:MAG: hypothetical protein ABI885_14150 [Gammaproteobacteria bacterium]